jgi:hypothetical protein
VMRPLAMVSGPGSEVSVALSLAALIGFAIMRDVIGVEVLKNANPAEIDQYFRKINGALQVK